MQLLLKVVNPDIFGTNIPLLNLLHLLKGFEIVIVVGNRDHLKTVVKGDNSGGIASSDNLFIHLLCIVSYLETTENDMVASRI